MLLLTRISNYEYANTYFLTLIDAVGNYDLLCFSALSK